MKKVLFLVAIVIASGCTQLSGVGEQPSAELIAEVDKTKITNETPGQLTLNARNLEENATFYYATVNPVGDYNDLVEVVDRNGNPKSGFGLGDAPKGATTGETFAYVKKELNVSSTVRLKVKLFEKNSAKEIDTDIKRMRLVEEDG